MSSSKYQRARGHELVSRKMISPIIENRETIGYQVKSLSRKNKVHFVVFVENKKDLTCDCEAIEKGHMKSCSHIAGVRLYRRHIEK